MRIISVKVGQDAEVCYIDNELEALQEFVGGYIEAVYPWMDKVALVCNEEGKLMELPHNRIIAGDNGFYDDIAGDFFICGLGYDDFADFPEELIDKYLNKLNTAK